MPQPSPLFGGGSTGGGAPTGGGGNPPAGMLSASGLREISRAAGLPTIFGDTIAGDATPDLRAALVDHITAGGGDFLIAGKYDFQTPLIIDDIDTDMKIRGDDRTALTVSMVDDFLQLSTLFTGGPSPEEIDVIKLHDLRFVAGVPGAGRAFDLRFPDYGNVLSRSTSIKNITGNIKQTSGEFPTGEYWANFCRLTNPWRGQYSNIYCMGPYGPNPAGGTLDLIPGGTGLEIAGRAFVSIFDDCAFWTFTEGMVLGRGRDGSAGASNILDDFEEFVFRECRAVQCTNGIVVHPNGLQPGGRVQGGHFNCTENNIMMTGIRSASVADVLLYDDVKDRANPFLGQHVDLRFVNCKEMNVKGNTTRGMSSDAGQRAFVRAESGSENLISEGNTIGQRDFRYIVANAAANGTLGPDKLIAPENAKITGAPQSVVGHYFIKPKATVVQNVSAQTIATGGAGAAALELQTAAQQLVGDWWNAANPTRLTVPAERAVRFVKINATVRFAPNAVGTRRVRVLKNGAVAAGLPDEIVMAAGAGPTHVTLSADSIPVADGDYFEVFVEQSSGGDLQTVPGLGTFVTIQSET
ncbi:MAG: hypothetical protein AAFW83_10420 [Pseudomonadota bacterium]